MRNLKTPSKAGLQIKMTAYVTTVVLVATAAVLLFMASKVRAGYERLLDERLDDDLTAITRNIEQRMMRVEDVTTVLASNVDDLISDKRDLDSLLSNSFKVMKDIVGVSLIFKKGFFPGYNGYFERIIYNEDKETIRLEDYENGDELENEISWVRCYSERRSMWGEPMLDPFNQKIDIIYFYTPAINDDNECIGMAYSCIRLSYFTQFVTNHKVRKDIDISVYNENGTMLVAPDSYIKDIAPENLISRESRIDHLGWTVRLSADKNTIDKAVRKTLISLALLMLLMFIIIAITIRITVRTVARPFVLDQQRIEKEKAVIDNELKLASKAQNELVPHSFPPFPQRKGIDIAACLFPARDVGGDLYDYFILDNKLYFCIGDVSGKGLQASLFMSATHYLFRSVVAGMSSREAVKHMNTSLCTDNEQCRFVTFWLGCLDLGSGVLEFVNAGHDSPVIIRGGNADMLPPSPNMPLGIDESEEYISDTLTLDDGDTLLLYTDGITEAKDADSNDFGKHKMLEAVSAATPVADASTLIGSINRSVRQHASGTPQSDDITMLCIRFITKEHLN